MMNQYFLRTHIEIRPSSRDDLSNRFGELSNQNCGWPMANPSFSSGNRFIMTRVRTRCFYVRDFPLASVVLVMNGLCFLCYVGNGNTQEYLTLTV